MKMFIAGAWTAGRQTLDVRNPYDGAVIDSVPKATADEVEQALAASIEGA